MANYTSRLHACCNLSGLIILLVNIIEFPAHPLVVSDWNLIARLSSMFEQMNAKASQEPFFVLQVVKDLDRRARGQVKRLAHMHSFELQGAISDDILAMPWTGLDMMFM